MPAVGRVSVSLRRSTGGLEPAGVPRLTGPPDPRAPLLQHLRDLKRQLDRLTRVQPWVAGGFVPPGQVSVDDVLGPPEALGHVVAGELDVDAAGDSAQLGVYGEEASHLGQDALEVPGLVPARRLDRCCRASGRRPRPPRARWR